MDATQVLDFWFQGERDRYRVDPWFRKNDAFDSIIREKFATAVVAAQEGAFADWAMTASGTLGLVILLDQFPRNIHRGSKLAFACDARARDVARGALALAGELTQIERCFLYLPFEHAENLFDQDVSVHLFSTIADDPRMPTVLDYAERHRDVIRRFGRFPHRNAAVGRENSAAETAYLAEPGAGF